MSPLAARSHAAVREGPRHEAGLTTKRLVPRDDHRVCAFIVNDDQPPEPRLVHFTGRPRGGTSLPVAVAHLDAEERLANILATGGLRAFPVHGTGDTSVVCVSDISPADLAAAFRTGLNTRGPFEPWALVLGREIMWGAGARPVVYSDYVRARILREALDGWSAGQGALVQRVDLNVYRSDWTHEREWRWLPPEARDELPVWPQLDAVIVGRQGWQPPNLGAHPDAVRVRRWWYTRGKLVDDGRIVDGSSL